MGDNVELIKVFIDFMFFLVDHILVLMSCPSGGDRGNNYKCLVIKLCGIAMKSYDISQTSEGPPESLYNHISGLMIP